MYKSIKHHLPLAIMLLFLFQSATSADTLYTSTQFGLYRISSTGVKANIFHFSGAYHGIAFDETGNLYLADNGLGKIYRFTSTGAQTTFASIEYSNPSGLAFDSNGNLFASKFGASVSEISPSGNVSTFASGLALPFGLTFDTAGSLFVADGNDNRIVQYSPDGSESTFASGFSAADLAFDANGNLFVTVFGLGIIYEFTPQGVQSIFASDLNGPYGLAFDSSGDLYVAEYSNFSIAKFTPDGTKSTFATLDWNPSYLAFAPVPEPSAFLFVSISLIGMCLRRRRS